MRLPLLFVIVFSSYSYAQEAVRSSGGLKLQDKGAQEKAIRDRSSGFQKEIECLDTAFATGGEAGKGEKLFSNLSKVGFYTLNGRRNNQDGFYSISADRMNFYVYPPETQTQNSKYHLKILN